MQMIIIHKQHEDATNSDNIQVVDKRFTNN